MSETGSSIQNPTDEGVNPEAYARAILNILEDAEAERVHLGVMQRAVLNILDDSAAEKMRMSEAQRATLNILDDFDIEKRKTEQANADLRTEIVERAQVEQSLREANAAAESARFNLTRSLKEREVLLQEIHHRVKNNLAVISSLFYLESPHTSDATTARVFQESRLRVRSMALVHETLYGSENLAQIDLAQYTRALTTELLTTYRPGDDRVRLKTDLLTLNISIDLAVPCGLILNELVSNAFKHGFPSDRRGTVTVAVLTGHDGLGVIQVSDDGVGIPADLDIDTHASLGLRLIRALTDQISGTFDLTRGHPGTEARVTFGLEEHGQRS